MHLNFLTVVNWFMFALSFRNQSIVEIQRLTRTACLHWTGNLKGIQALG